MFEGIAPFNFGALRISYRTANFHTGAEYVDTRELFAADPELLLLKRSASFRTAYSFFRPISIPRS